MSVDDIESLSVTHSLERFPGNVFICSGKWSPAEYKKQVSEFLKGLKKLKTSVKRMEGDWWGSALVGLEREEAFARASMTLKAAF